METIIKSIEWLVLLVFLTILYQLKMKIIIIKLKFLNAYDGSLFSFILISEFWLSPNFVSNIKQILANFYSSLKSSKNLWFSDDFRGNKS